MSGNIIATKQLFGSNFAMNSATMRKSARHVALRETGAGVEDGTTGRADGRLQGAASAGSAVAAEAPGKPNRLPINVD
jgi:hypothetical protein